VASKACAREHMTNMVINRMGANHLLRIEWGHFHSDTRAHVVLGELVVITNSTFSFSLTSL
jgi:hypothetical protein